MENLSGGERQRLAVASALVHRPDIVFLDEPTAGLDAAARHDLVRLLQSPDVIGMTTVYTTHHLDEAERLCDTVSIIDDGRVLTTASPTSLIASAHLETTIILPAALHQIDDIDGLPAITSARGTTEGAEVRTHDTAAAFAALSAADIDTSVKGQRFLPGGGHETCPVAVTSIARWWPWDLPKGLATSGRGVVRSTGSPPVRRVLG